MKYGVAVWATALVVGLCIACLPPAEAEEVFTFESNSGSLKELVDDILLQTGQRVAESSEKDDDDDAKDTLEAEDKAPPEFFKQDLQGMQPDQVVKTLGNELRLMSQTLFNKLRTVSSNVKVFTKKSKALYSTVQDMKRELKNVKGNLGNLEGDREKMQNTLKGAVGGLEGQLSKANKAAGKMKGQLKQDESIKGALSRLAGNMKALYGKVDHLKRAISRVRREADKIKQAQAGGCGGGGGGPAAKPKMSCSCRATKDPQNSIGEMELNEEDPAAMKGYFGASASKFSDDDPVAQLAAETDPVTLLQEDASVPDKKVCYCDDGIDALMELELDFGVE